MTESRRRGGAPRGESVLDAQRPERKDHVGGGVIESAHPVATLNVAVVTSAVEAIRAHDDKAIPCLWPRRYAA